MRAMWLSAALLFSSLGEGQVTGTFALDKQGYAPGEPVFLNFTLRNEGAEPKEVETADPYSFCSGYSVAITRMGTPHLVCYQGWGGSCLSGAVTLGPHRTRTERLLLNYQNNGRGDLNPPVHAPGEYTIHATRTIKEGVPGAFPLRLRGGQPNEVHQVLNLRVDTSLAVSAATYASYVHQLGAADSQARSEAARTLATLAPATLEPLLLSLATSTDPQVKQFAPMALANLATPASLNALAAMVRHEQSGSYESISAAEYLGRTHDPKWYPLLLEFADRHGSMYLRYAAESGEAAIPALQLRLGSADPDVRSSTIFALGSTASREAVPVLIGLLRGPEGTAIEASTANAALQQLTHRVLPSGISDPWAGEAYRRWQQWWLTAGKDAKVYSPGECVEDVPLP